MNKSIARAKRSDSSTCCGSASLVRFKISNIGSASVLPTKTKCPIDLRADVLVQALDTRRRVGAVADDAVDEVTAATGMPDVNLAGFEADTQRGFEGVMPRLEVLDRVRRL
jgi:hypothetical protein